MRKHTATILQAAGVLTGSAAGFTVCRFLGLAVLSAGLILFGLAAERG